MSSPPASGSSSAKDAAFETLRKESKWKVWRSRATSAALVASLGVNVWLGMSVSQDSHGGRLATENTRKIVVSVVCGMNPTPAGCPAGSHPTQTAQSQQQIVDQIINGPKVVAKEECVASAQQLAITNPSVPASLLDDPCDAIK